MDEDLLVLLEPVIELVPVERHVALDVGPIGDGFLVGPHRVLGSAAVDLDRPVRRLTLVGTGRALVGRHEVEFVTQP